MALPFLLLRIGRPAAGVTADSTLWTADTHCITADGRIVCAEVELHEAAVALDSLDAVTVAAPILADVVEAAAASDLADAVSDVAADAIEPADALDQLDAVADVTAALAEAADALDALDAVTVGAVVVAGVSSLFAFWLGGGAVAIVGGAVIDADVAEAAVALDQLDADVVPEIVEVPGGGAYYPPPQRPLPVYGIGYGILPQLWGEAHGVVGVVGQSAAQVLVRAAAIGACGQAGDAAVTLKALSVAGHGAVGTRGSGEGMIMKFSGSATGRHDDDEAAVIAFLLAA